MGDASRGIDEIQEELRERVQGLKVFGFFVERDMEKDIVASVTMARAMRGHVPEWDDTYLEKQIPEDLLARMYEEASWVDDDGFSWGFRHVMASILWKTGERVVNVASKYEGHGSSLVKVVMPDKSIRIVTSGQFSNSTMTLGVVDTCNNTE